MLQMYWYFLGNLQNYAGNIHKVIGSYVFKERSLVPKRQIVYLYVHIR